MAIHCNYCCCKLRTKGRKTKGGRMKPDAATIDHVLPLSKGGLDNAGNRVVACHACNNKKGDNHLWKPKFFDDGTPRYDMTTFKKQLNEELESF